MATSEHQICSKLGQQDLDHPPIRRSSGRRKAKGGGGDPKKTNKPRQRGMGMAKLEQQRLKELLESTDQPTFHPHYPNLDPTRNPASLHALIGDDRRLLNSQVTHVLGNVVKCYSLHCNACHKKKKINGEDLGKTLENQDFMNESNIRAGNYGKKVEVVAVHRRGSSSGWDGGKGVLMEYDFFPPAKNGASFGSEEKACGSSSMAVFDVDLSLKLSY